MAASVRAALCCLLVAGLGFSAAQFVDFPAGDYCGAHGVSRCCDGRLDTCSVPVLGTLCYCDQFCNRTRADDCCPDYWKVCLGIEPPPAASKSCYHDGQYVPYGKSIKENCNECVCGSSPSNPDKLEMLCETSACLVQPDVIIGVNNQVNLGWQASNYSEFWGRKLDDGIVLRLGTLEPERFVLAMHPIRQQYDAGSLPRYFDSRKQWKAQLQPISDQGWCGASWAFSTTSVAADRLALQSNGKEVHALSTQNLISCNNRGQQGCNGGHLDRAWNYMRRFGVVNDECYRYTSGSTSSVEKCRVPRNANLLTMRCALPNANNVPFAKQRKELFLTPPAYRIASNEYDIMNEILQRGPVQATMKVSPDFFMYRGGVYRSSGLTSAQRTGYHSVRIIGWGEDSALGFPVKYWLVANSWGEGWGENGYFRILRGQNESDIEKFVLAAWADIKKK